MGAVTPDTYVVNKSTLTVNETIIGEKNLMIVSADQGVQERETSADERVQSSLGEAQLMELSAQARKIEQHYDGAPQDIEWAYAGSKLWLLQSRPITRLPVQPSDATWEVDGPDCIYSRRQIVELMLDPLSTLFEDLYLPAFNQENFKTLNGFAYTRIPWKFSNAENHGIPNGNVDETEESRAQGPRRRQGRPDPARRACERASFVRTCS